MKTSSQILAIFLVGSNSLQIIVTLVTAILFLHLLLSKVQGTWSRWIIKRKTRSIDADIWAIE